MNRNRFGEQRGHRTKQNSGQCCGMCRRHARKLFTWGQKRLCRNCYRTHCKSYIRVPNLLKKFQTRNAPPSPVYSSEPPQKPSLWRWLFG